MTRFARLSSLIALAAALAACGPGGDSAGQPRGNAFWRTDAVTTVCGSTSVKGIDVSSWQGSSINWSSVAGSGLKFAIARISDGTGYPDSDFARNWAGIKSAGMIRGAYQYFEPGQSATAQANMVVSAVGKLGAGDLPVTLDVEKATPTASELQTWLDIVEAGTGKKPIIYTSWGLWNGWLSGGFESYPLWAANYGVSCPGLANHWTSWKFWQYADNTAVPGIGGSVDGDYWNGTLAQLQDFAGKNDCGGKPNGTYCGGDGPTGDADTLYTCANNAATVEEVCPGWCATGPAGDFCARRRPAPHGVDLDGDHKADVCGRDSSGVTCWTSGHTPFGDTLNGPGLTDGSGWGSINYFTSIQLADVNGDGKADVCGRGVNGAMCWLGSGAGFPTATDQGPLTNAAGWSAPKYRETIQWADVNGDGKDDLCARAAANFSCWLSTGTQFGTKVDLPNMGNDDGWDVPEYYGTIVAADVTGDGKADVCGRGWGGFECWKSTGSAFTAVGTYVDAFSNTNHGDDPSVYATLQLGDVTGDGKLDVCGRTHTNYVCFKGGGNGKFTTQITGPAMADAQGWNKGKYYSSIQLADVNGDGKADVCARSSNGVHCWLSNGSGFPTEIDGPALTNASGWDQGVYASTIRFADVDGDGRADVCARAAAGLQCWLSTGTGFASTAIDTGLFSDADHFDDPRYLTTLQLAGNPFPRVPASTGTTSGSTGATTGSTGTSGTTGPDTGGDSTGGDSTGGSSGSTGADASTGSSGTRATTGTAGGIASAGGSTGKSGAKGDDGGGCSSASGGALFGLLAVLGLLRRRQLLSNNRSPPSRLRQPR